MQVITTAYDYDFLGQLVGADYSNTSTPDETYTYDFLGQTIPHPIPFAFTGKTKAQEKSNNAQIKRVRRKNAGNMEGNLRGAMLGMSNCPQEEFDVSGSVTFAFFAGVFYGKEGYVTFWIDDIRQPLNVTGAEIGSNNVFGRIGVELSLTIAIVATGILFS